MFTQFFGNYLLNQHLVANWQLIEALELQKNTKLKLGVLAINAGLMTAEQVDEVHAAQQRVDKRMGDIAVAMGYLTPENVTSLLSSQKTGHLLLGQALVDKGYMTNKQFETALAEYKTANQISESDFTSSQKEKVEAAIRSFYNFTSFKNAEIFTEYLALLFKNLIRFIGDDFAPLDAKLVTSYPTIWLASQVITGKFNAYSAIEGTETAFINFASRYAQESFTENDEYVKASIAEFLNLHNGLFTVNMSNERQLELGMAPQLVDNKRLLKTSSDMFCIPICFPFGTVNILLSNDMPKVI